MPEKALKRKNQSLLPTELLSTLEKSDKKASTKRRKLFTTHTLPKSLATKSQYNIQTNLIECRILLQRALTCFNEDSSVGSSVNLNDGGESNDDMIVAEKLDTLLERLVDARDTLCQHTLQIQKEAENDESSSDEHANDNNDDDHDNNRFQKDYNYLKSYWKTVLNRHHDNMNITKRYNKKDSNSKFFQVVDQSFWSQVTNTVEHNMLLEQHTQINPPNDDVHGAKLNAANQPSLHFDDAKIYQNMLQEYITLSSERTANNATSLAEHRLKLASSGNQNKKHKNDVDRRASKGRKIRYVVHEKLRNFTFPIQRELNSQMNHAIMDEDVLFKSMMGGVVNSKNLN